MDSKTQQTTDRAVIDAAAPVIAPPSPNTRYVSIFEDPGRFAQQIKIAEALSRTQFVPQAFRGKPEDCLVALDLACRFELQPLAVFPELYVIDNRASFSSKFLIALVNRSGRFSRIQWDEGVDGEVKCKCSEWKKNGERGARDEWEQTFANRYAIAYFTELSTGERFESPRVDMRFADANGWIYKPGSKWRSMAEIMCRYRAASILIKSVCPEIIAGLEFSEDVQDARELDAPVITVRAREAAPRVQAKLTPAPALTRAPEFPSDAALEFNKRLQACSTVDELNAVAADISAANLHDREVQELRARYSDCKQALIDKAEPLTPYEQIASAIAKACTADALAQVVDDIDASALSNQDKLTLKQRVEARAVELE